MENIQSKKLKELETFFNNQHYEINIDENDTAFCTVLVTRQIIVDKNGRYCDKLFKNIYDTPQEVLDTLIQISKNNATKRLNYYRNNYLSLKIRTNEPIEDEPFSIAPLIEKSNNCKKEIMEINNLIAELSYCADIAKIYNKINFDEYSDYICYGYRILNGYEIFDDELYYQKKDALKEKGSPYVRVD